MGNQYRTCELHEKEFPNNLIDTSKTGMCKLYIEQPQTIEGEQKTLTLFVGDSQDEGIDVCMPCMTKKVMGILTGMGIKTSWKIATWEKVIMQKKDGTPYERNTKIVKTVEEVTEEIRKRKSQTVAPKAT